MNGPDTPLPSNDELPQTDMPDGVGGESDIEGVPI